MILFLKDKKNYEPIILLITPVEEIISPNFIKKYLNARKYIPCWKSLKIILEENNSINQNSGNRSKYLQDYLERTLFSPKTIIRLKWEIPI